MAGGFIDKNYLAEAGFYYRNHSYVLCCAFCCTNCIWQGDDAFMEHRLWSPNCQFIRGLSVGNYPIGFSDQRTESFKQPSKAVLCVVIIFSNDPIHTQNVVSILACFSSILIVSIYCRITNFQRSVLATSPRIYKHTVRRHDCIDWYHLLYARFIT